MLLLTSLEFSLFFLPLFIGNFSLCCLLNKQLLQNGNWVIQVLMPCKIPLLSISFNVCMLHWPNLKCHFIVSVGPILSTRARFNLSFKFGSLATIRYKDPSLIHSNLMCLLRKLITHLIRMNSPCLLTFP